MSKYKLAVIGAGRMGPVVAWDLCRNEAVEQVTLVDVSAEPLQAAKQWIEATRPPARLETKQLDVVRDPRALEDLLRGQDAAVITMPNRLASYSVIRRAIEARCPVVDILEEYHRVPDKEEIEGLDRGGLTSEDFGKELHQDAVAAGICVLDGMGFEPGLTNVTAGDGIRKLDGADVELEVKVRVGGVPAVPFRDSHPLRYMLTWSFEHVLREYVIGTTIIKNGEHRPAEAAEEVEEVDFGGDIGMMEAAFTPGMPSYLHTWTSLTGRIRDFDAKTLRWPGHWQAIQTLKSLGLLDAKQQARIAFRLEGSSDPGGGQPRMELSVTPRQVLANLLQPALTPGAEEFDLAVMRVVVAAQGPNGRDTKSYGLAVEGEPHGGPDGRLSAMAKVTAFPAAWGGLALAARRIDKPGVIAPEEIVFDHPEGGPQHYSDLKAYLSAESRGVEIVEG